MNTYLSILLVTALTGVGGLAAAVRNPSDRTISLLLRFTTGVICSVVCFDLIADAAEAVPGPRFALDLSGLSPHLSPQLLDR